MASRQLIAFGPRAACPGRGKFVRRVGARLSVLIVLIALGVAVGQTASVQVAFADDQADDDDDDDDDDDQADDDDDDDEDLEEARELYSKGNSHYAAGRYEKAAKAFLRGYKLSRLPGFLYNLANAYERMGEYRKAAKRLELYLKSPKAKDVVSVRERARRLEAAADDRERELRKQKALEDKAERDRKRREADGATVAGPQSKEHLYWLGGGAVALVAATSFGGLSLLSATKAEGGCSTSGVCSRDVEKDLDRERTYAIVADISLGLGVALVSAGAVIYFLNRPKKASASDSGTGDDDDDDDVAFAPMASADGFGVAILGRF